MTRRVTVIVEGREYHVEVEDLTARPIRATVNQKTYNVYLRSRNSETESEGPPAVRVEPAMPAPQVPRPARIVQPAGRDAQPANGAVITSPMPGDIAEVRVKVGDPVQPGDVVCVLEAMKMKNLIHTAHAGVVASVAVEAGQTVDYGAVLVTLN